MNFVVDASVALAWCFKDESSRFTAEVLELLTDGQAVVPQIWPLEVANGLLVGERRKRLTASDHSVLFAYLDALPIRVDERSAANTRGPSFALAREHGLSVYDACYLELAMRQSLPLATLDVAMKKAAKKAGVKLVDA